MRAYVNERPVNLAEDATVADAILAADPHLARIMTDAGTIVTDARGIALGTAEPLRPGSIIRVVVSARRTGARPEGADADA